MAQKQQYWLIKSEPDAYSIEDLEREGKTGWDGIRNYQARNLMRDDMQVGDLALFYHSSCKVPGVVGIARVCSAPHPDPSAFDASSKYYDAKSNPEDPRWVMVDFEFVCHVPRPEAVSLAELKASAELSGMRVVQRGQRLSIQPVEPADFRLVCKLAGVKQAQLKSP